MPDNLDLEEGQSVVAGIRPEHLTLGEEEGSFSMPISLDLVETLGGEALLHAAVGGENIIVKAATQSGDVGALSGTTQVYAAINRVKVFDETSGLAIAERTS